MYLQRLARLSVVERRELQRCEHIVRLPGRRRARFHREHRRFQHRGSEVRKATVRRRVNSRDLLEEYTARIRMLRNRSMYLPCVEALPTTQAHAPRPLTSVLARISRPTLPVPAPAASVSAHHTYGRIDFRINSRNQTT